MTVGFAFGQDDQWTCLGICGYSGAGFENHFGVPSHPAPQVPIGTGQTPKDAFEAALKQCTSPKNWSGVSGPFLVKQFSVGNGLTRFSPVLLSEACVRN